jgi:hypothetical protein
MLQLLWSADRRSSRPPGKRDRERAQREELAAIEAHKSYGETKRLEDEKTRKLRDLRLGRQRAERHDPASVDRGANAG